LSAAAYQRVLLSHSSRATREVSESLQETQLQYIRTLVRAVPLMADLSEKEVSAVAGALELVRLKAGEIVIQQGAPGTEMYFVEAGTLLCTASSPERPQDPPRQLAFPTAGDFFGERAMLSREPRAATITAQTDVRLLRLDSATGERVLMHSRASASKMRQRQQAYEAQNAIGREPGGGTAGRGPGGFGKHFVRDFAINTRALSQRAVDAFVDVAEGSVTRVAAEVGKAVDKVVEAAEAVVDELEGVAADGVAAMKKVAGIVENGDNDDGVEDSHNGALDFEEFMGLLRGPLLAPYLPAADWSERVSQIRQLRQAFDTADVDGSNELEEGELEVVMLALDPGAQRSLDDVDHVWRILNPCGHQFLTWTEFLVGLPAVRVDARARAAMDLSQPNKWELISLLVDTTVPAAEEQRLLAGLAPLEKFGVKTLKNMQGPALGRARVQEVLGKACRGELRMLSPEKIGRITAHRRRVVVYALLIGLFTNCIPALAENYITDVLETDGVADAYWVCNNRTVGTGAWVWLAEGDTVILHCH
jgi:CRP-like cAMP-binding protein